MCVTQPNVGHGPCILVRVVGPVTPVSVDHRSHRETATARCSALCQRSSSVTGSHSARIRLCYTTLNGVCLLEAGDIPEDPFTQLTWLLSLFSLYVSQKVEISTNNVNGYNVIIDRTTN